MRRNIFKYEHFYGPFINERVKQLGQGETLPYDDELRKTLDA